MRRTIAVLARAPVPGRAKTRMIGALGPDGAAALQRACIEVIVDRSWPADERVLWVAGDDPVWEHARAAGWSVREQPDGGLDVRIATALDAAASHGAALVLGTDSPDLPEAMVDEAYAALASDPFAVHLTPTIDGGFAAIGASRAVGDALRGVTWSASSTLLETVAALRAVGRGVSLGGYWYDLDEVADLRRLWVHSVCASVGPVPYCPGAVLEVLSAYPVAVRLPLTEQRIE